MMMRPLEQVKEEGGGMNVSFWWVKAITGGKEGRSLRPLTRTRIDAKNKQLPDGRGLGGGARGAGAATPVTRCILP